jgi:type II restriction/modification system DNA methylase subunit YeeA
MKLNAQTPKISLNKAFLKQPVNRDAIESFKANLQTLLGKINENESEEHHKNFVRDFLKDTFYKSDYEINTKGRQDLVIHVGKNASDKVGVIVETKKPTNKADMITAENPNRKALHELILYFLRERIDENNIDVKYLIVTNINEWFIFDASVFNRLFYENKAFAGEYKQWRDRLKISSNTDLFYKEIAKPYIDSIDEEIPCTHFDIRDYETALNNADLKDDKSLIELFKILSPHHLLKEPFADDSNKLDRNFYTELLHIIGLEEIKDKGKLKIDRKTKEKRDSGSLIENAIDIIETKDCLYRVKNLENYGETKEKRLFGVALELCLTWINRVLFLKLLEAQLVDYHKGNREYRFLDIQTISDFDELFTLFHQVLAKLPEERRENIKAKYSRVPYLNSSLFETSELENDTVTIESLKNTIELPFIKSTVLKDAKAKQSGLPTLEYLFRFLDAYDFASEGMEEIAENNRSLINASVLGTVFEKINGYKDGSIYTPGFITMYMCRQAIRLAVVQKFKEAYGWNISEFADIKNYLADRRSKADVLEFNQLINSLHLCDPAVGSGHFLVSSLNEIIAIKSELGILADENGERFRDYEITIENDELTVFDAERNEFFKYRLQDGRPQSKEAQRLQKTLFHEKQAIIENCLFGVDINPNSVKICRLRLWIELLKNAYYKESTDFRELETLPNIDINIKEGNSLVSRFALDEDLSAVLSKVKYSIEDYQNFVLGYKETRDREKKREFEKKIKQIKDEFRVELNHFSPERKQLAKLENELFEKQSKQFLFGEDEDKRKKRLKRIEELKFDIDYQKQKIKEIEENAIYKNAFEWRFEFPEVLDNEGSFTGFDIVIGNPPYIRQEELGTLKDYLKKDYEVFTGTADILVYFYELGLRILKQNGKFSFITSNKFMRANYGKPLRNFLWKQNILDIVDFGELPVFDEAATFPVIVNLEKTENKKSVRFTQIKTLEFDWLETVINKTSNILPVSAFENENWTLTNSESIDIINKIKSFGFPLREYANAEIRRGILTGFNEAFVIDEDRKNELISQDANSAEIIKPFIVGDDVRKYSIKNGKSKYIILTKIGIEIEKYPAIFNYLKQYQSQLEKRWDKGNHWFELRTCAYYEDFEKPKIIYPVIGKESRFTFSEETVFTNDKAFIIPVKNLFLLAFLNSKVAWFYLKNICSVLGDADKGGRLELRTIHVQTLPIPKIEEKDQQPFVALVDQILELKKQGKDSQALEDEIDRLVYRLYDLTDEEIAIVEGK